MWIRSKGPIGLPKIVFVLCAISLWGCSKPSGPPEVVVYTALDQEFSKPIFEKFTADTGILVTVKYDTESTKTVGLTQTILAESKRPRCDLFWNNEILNTERLERAGLLRAYNSPVGAEYPASARSPKGLWYGFAARARVLVVNSWRSCTKASCWCSSRSKNLRQSAPRSCNMRIR